MIEYSVLNAYPENMKLIESASLLL